MFNNPLLFISHAEKDIMMVEKFVDLLYAMGVSEKSMFCSSISELGVPIKEDIYGYLRGLLDSEQVIPIFMLSNNYYSSAACLNEMGAVWMKQKDYFTFLLPDFGFSEIKGAINAGKRGISLWYESERELQNLKKDLDQFREEISRLFGVEKYGHWERKRDEFITQIQKLRKDTEVVIDLKDCGGYCVGEYEHDGCNIMYDKTMNKIISKIEFAETEAKICSIVIFAGGVDVASQYKGDKCLVFDMKTTNTISTLDVECKLKDRDVRTTIVTSLNWENYRIPLSEFGGRECEWRCLREIKFLLRRKASLGGSVEIKNMRIK